MKKSLLFFLLFVGVSGTLNAQITKADLLGMMTDMGTSPEKIATVYVGNTMTYFKDGTSKQFYSKYTGDKGNVVTLTDYGIRVNWQPEGTAKSIFYIPYSSIITINVEPDYLSIYLLR